MARIRTKSHSDMKTITAVQCKACQTLIDSTDRFLAVDEIRLTKMNERGPDVNQTAWFTKEVEAFCNSECLYKHIRKECEEEEVQF